jgi:hypothetical protein
MVYPYLLCMATTTQGAEAMTTNTINIEKTITEYRAARDAYIAACEQSDRAFRRYMNGEVKTARGAGRLAAKVEQAGGDCDHARYEAMDAGIDTDAIDNADGLLRDHWTLNYREVAA